jgi:hypothetical protein
MKLIEKHYHEELEASEYDFLDVTEDIEGRIKVSFLESRWRTKEETIALFKECIKHLSDMPSPEAKD